MLSSPNVLVVEDNEELRDVLADVLAPISASVRAASTVAHALPVLREHLIDVIVTDICMPGERGTKLLAYSAEHQNDPAVIIITGNATLSDALEGVHLRASDFLLKPFSKSKLCASVVRAFAELQERRASARFRTACNAECLQLETLIETLDACEHDTCLHSLRVLEYCMHLANHVGYPEAEFPALARAALLHDIGKIGIPESVLLKPDRLTPEESEVMKSHVLRGVRIMERVPTLRESLPIVLHHHEHYDGNGYPNGSKGKDIPLGARIFTVVDTLDAMTSDRPYRRALSFVEARTEIQRCSAHQFDPEVVNAFLALPTETWEQLRGMAENSSKLHDALFMWLMRRNPAITNPSDSYENRNQIYA
ncbi:MAG TPA: HD domain-containing phosphohydrolase [Candidatus Acidoferrales bacterium]|nr:HD domain-containing phosphohydrolase [Candidatus Acidoferrales bacterium]